MRGQLSRIAMFLGLIPALVAGAAHAEFQISAYGGANENFDSKIKLNKGNVSDSRTVSWDGKSFQAPQYWGVRGTYWFKKGTSWGVALDYTHAKAYADVNFTADPVYDHLEFTDGNNIFTIDAMYRYNPKGSGWSYYVGGGPGIAVPHVEVELDAYPNEKTRRYQVTGLAAQVLGGAEYRFAQHWGAFGEARLSYTDNNSDLIGGGTAKTEIWSPHLSVGLSYHI